ncbi:methionyl-tRNA formyltransferase [Pseudoalteromonas pernae]|uniref:methionyl-tRNA formyltransferase n=1 Tax=Pseudoalteromonas pernae TaxID=3118054 RepID=UPI0032424D4F
MKIGYFADGPWSHKAIERILDNDEFEIVFIVPRYETRDRVLKQWAEKLNVPFIVASDVNSPDFIEQVKAFEADIFVSMSFNQILKEAIISVPPRGFINCHAGALPFYRGRNPLNWALINGEERFGITVHYIDEGIDTGDIIEQAFFQIGPHDNYGSLLEVAIEGCAEVLIKALLGIKSNKVKALKQSDIHPVGTYFGMRRVGDEYLEFCWGAQRLHNFVRALATPGPEARFFVGEIEYALVKTSLIAGAPNYIATEGEVVGRTHEGVVVKVGDSTLAMNLIREVSQGSVPTDAFIPRFAIGTRLQGRNNR